MGRLDLLIEGSGADLQQALFLAGCIDPLIGEMYAAWCRRTSHHAAMRAAMLANINQETFQAAENAREATEPGLHRMVDMLNAAPRHTTTERG
jgi:hypothetical protein